MVRTNEVGRSRIRGPIVVSEIDFNSESEAPVTGVIFDSNPLLAEAMAQSLSETGRIELLGYGIDGTSVEDVLAELQPDVAIFDPCQLALRHDYDIGDFSRAVTERVPDLKLMAYSEKSDAQMLRATFAANFRGYVSKKSTLPQVKIALTAIIQGGMYFDRVMGEKLRPMVCDDQQGAELLSRREREVLVGIAQGLGMKQIALQLDLSTKTVETYKARARQKLDLNDRSDILDYVMRAGWLSTAG